MCGPPYFLVEVIEVYVHTGMYISVVVSIANGEGFRYVTPTTGHKARTGKEEDAEVNGEVKF